MTKALNWRFQAFLTFGKFCGGTVDTEQSTRNDKSHITKPSTVHVAEIQNTRLTVYYLKDLEWNNFLQISPDDIRSFEIIDLSNNNY